MTPRRRSRVHRIGLISDTHGLLRPRVHEAFAGVEAILHAGDVGGEEILTELALIAPVHAVFGNTDTPGEGGLVGSLVHKAGQLRIRVVHGHLFGKPTAEALVKAYQEDVIVFGHTHRQEVSRLDSRLVVNPGAAGAARFDLPPSCAVLMTCGFETEVEVIPLA